MSLRILRDGVRAGDEDGGPTIGGWPTSLE
ncbi:hypothetical protein E3G44_000568 [Mycobacteroides abscessus]|nr:hypothetical protein [Mycobacteroides abscessus]